MFSWKEFEKNKEVLSHMGGQRYKDEWGQHHLTVSLNELLDWVEFLKEDLGYFTLTEIAAGSLEDGRIELIYHLLNMGSHQRLNLHLSFFEGEMVPSIVRFFPHAEWPERERQDFNNVFFDEKRAPLFSRHEEEIKFPALPYNPNKSEAPYPEESYKWKHFDLLSPVTKGHFEALICFDPVKAVEARLRIGYYHQGFERMMENKDIIHILQLIDKVNLKASPTYSIAWARTVEEMFRIKIPERAQAIRIVLLELSRIAEHLSVLAAVSMAASSPEYTTFINSREKIYELFEKFSGHRLGVGSAAVGGTKEDLPPGWIVEYQGAADLLVKNLRTVNKSLINSRRFREALQGEPLNAQSMLQWGISGPAMRAAGLNFDLRKSQPFYFYQDIDFDIPVGINGTGYDRYLIRFEEILQSFRIITQVIDNLPLGEVISIDFNKNYFEILQNLEKLEQPKQWHGSAIESPSGEAGFLVKFGTGLKPLFFKMKTSSFFIAQAAGVFLKGLTEDQVAANIASLGISRWEMDR